MKLDTARRFALSLPETTEEPHFDKSSFRVKGKIFCTVPADGTTLHIGLGSADEVQALVAEQPEAFEVIVWGKREVSDWVRVHLPKADRAVVCELLEDAWRAKAPKRVLAAHDAATG
ncbi:MAG TPA: MmcQ/YjbR family DNA-binding protein [Acidimicrobiales bacterium]|nr:MmcQ/YjbR family DNA-binding protein [Acidimicrobiales bacterium]